MGVEWVWLGVNWDGRVGHATIAWPTRLAAPLSADHSPPPGMHCRQILFETSMNFIITVDLLYEPIKVQKHKLCYI